MRVYVLQKYITDRALGWAQQIEFMNDMRELSQFCSCGNFISTHEIATYFNFIFWNTMECGIVIYNTSNSFF